MPVLNLDLDYTGKPTVQVYVSVGRMRVSELAEEGGSPPAPISLKALVDTGADQSYVAMSAIESLGLTPVTDTEASSASTGLEPEILDVYEVDLAFAGDQPGPLAFNHRVVGSAKLGGIKADMLLGRDLLLGGVFYYDGVNRRAAFAYDRPLEWEGPLKG